MNEFLALALTFGIPLILLVAWTFFPVGLWMAAIMSGVGGNPLQLAFTLVAMRLRGVPQSMIIMPLIQGAKAGVELDMDLLEAHYLASGNVAAVVNAIVAADKAHIPLGFQQAAAIDLAGRDVFQAVARSVRPWVIKTPVVTAMCKDGIQLRATATITVRTKIDKLIGGAGEETIVARVGEGICTTLGSAVSHAHVLENPEVISKVILAKGLDNNTAFEIVSIDIADIEMGRNIGAERDIERAEADMRIAEARASERMSMAQAHTQEMVAYQQEMSARVVEAQAQVPLALAGAFRRGDPIG